MATVDAYLKKAGLPAILSSSAKRSLAAAREELSSGGFSGGDLYRYPVPKLDKDGSCCLAELDSRPFDLAGVLGGRGKPNDILLEKLHGILKHANGKVGADWLGAYRKFGEGGGSRLVKLSYIGAPSRAEFPLTREFAKESVNSVVGMTGKAVVIKDVQAYASKGKPYYECDAKVNSEACLPVFNRGFSEVIGIVDAESRNFEFFGNSRLAHLAALSFMLGELLDF